MNRHWPPALVVGAVLVGLVVGIALLSLVWTPYDAEHVVVSDRFQPADRANPLGTDQLGRDELSRLMVGARTTLVVGVVTVVVALGLGVPLGAVAALRGGAVEEVSMRLSDLLLAFPALLLALLFAAVFQPGTVTAMAAIGIALVPVFARVVRSAALQVLHLDYVTVARSYGLGDVSIFLRHVLPNIGPLLIVQSSLAFAIAILAEAALSYLGLGTPSPTPSWGRMLSEAQSYLGQAPGLALWPGLAIASAVLGFNLLGDGLRVLLDPRAAAALPAAA